MVVSRSQLISKEFADTAGSIIKIEFLGIVSRAPSVPSSFTGLVPRAVGVNGRAFWEGQGRLTRPDYNIKDYVNESLSTSPTAAEYWPIHVLFSTFLTKVGYQSLGFRRNQFIIYPSL